VPGGQVAGAVANFGLTQFARARATSINLWLISWGLWFWIMIQLPLALFLIFSIGVAGALQGLWAELQSASEEGGLWGWGAYLASTFPRLVLDVFADLTGIDISKFDPNQFVTLIYGLNVLFGVMALFSVYIAYRFTFIRPLSGRAAGAKYGAVAIALAMYSIPIANLLPWFMLWCVVVWFFPR
jgi:hypothetical protein